MGFFRPNIKLPWFGAAPEEHSRGPMDPKCSPLTGSSTTTRDVYERQLKCRASIAAKSPTHAGWLAQIGGGRNFAAVINGAARRDLEEAVALCQNAEQAWSVSQQNGRAFAVLFHSYETVIGLLRKVRSGKAAAYMAPKTRSQDMACVALQYERIRKLVGDAACAYLTQLHHRACQAFEEWNGADVPSPDGYEMLEFKLNATINLIDKLAHVVFSQQDLRWSPDFVNLETMISEHRRSCYDSLGRAASRMADDITSRVVGQIEADTMHAIDYPVSGAAAMERAIQMYNEVTGSDLITPVRAKRIEVAMRELNQAIRVARQEDCHE